MLKKKIFSTMTLPFLLWVLIGFPLLNIDKALGQGGVVGVEVGDWVKYGNISVTWDSVLMEPDPEHVELNNTLWFKNEVLDIVDTAIYANRTTYFKNNTQRTSGFYQDFYYGDGNDTYMYISSGLQANDLLYPGGALSMWINKTIAIFYVGAIREANYLNILGTQLTEEEPAATVEFSVSYYWDKETGVLLERSGAGRYLDQSGVTIASWTRSDEIVETNLWSPVEKPQDPGIPYAIVGVATVAVILIGAWMFWPRKKKLRKRKPGKRR